MKIENNDGIYDREYALQLEAPSITVQCNGNALEKAVRKNPMISALEFAAHIYALTEENSNKKN